MLLFPIKFAHFKYSPEQPTPGSSLVILYFLKGIFVFIWRRRWVFRGRWGREDRGPRLHDVALHRGPQDRQTQPPLQPRAQGAPGLKVRDGRHPRGNRRAHGELRPSQNLILAKRIALGPQVSLVLFHFPSGFILYCTDFGNIECVH